MSKIAKDMKWNEWMDVELYFINQERDTMYLVEEGSGDNLLDEDINEGYVDYWLTSTFDLEKKEIVEEQAMWMETENIHEHDYTFGEIIERMKECDAPEGLENWEILPVDEGRKIRDELEEIDHSLWQEKVEEMKRSLQKENNTIENTAVISGKEDIKTEEKAQWLRERLGGRFDLYNDEKAIGFYYRAMHDNSYSINDADDYAYLNTLFGYDIGTENARTIIRWFKEEEACSVEESFSVSVEKKESFKNLCDLELGLDLDFSHFAKDEPKSFHFFQQSSDCDKKKNHKKNMPQSKSRKAR